MEFFYIECKTDQNYIIYWCMYVGLLPVIDALTSYYACAYSDTILKVVNFKILFHNNSEIITYNLSIYNSKKKNGTELN